MFCYTARKHNCTKSTYSHGFPESTEVDDFIEKIETPVS